MNILVTGAKGFVGRNLVENLKTLADGRNMTRPALKIDKIYEYDINNSIEELEDWCKDCDFVFNLAGVNRPKDNSEFQTGNFGFASQLLSTLKKYNNTCPVMLSSSIQASLAGRFRDSTYGKSKLAGEELFFKYSEETGAVVLVYRFPNLAGKWCRPNYNSAVATFCYNIAHDLPIVVNDRNTVLELLFIDDLVDEMLDALEGRPHRCDYPNESDNYCNVPTSGIASSVNTASTAMTASTVNTVNTASTAENVASGDVWNGMTPRPNEAGKYCYCPVTHKASLGEIVDLLESFRALNETLLIPEIPAGSLAYKLYSMYLSYLPESKMSYLLNMNTDERGTFTELIKTKNNGQVSINIARPGNIRGQHWHNKKWEIFIVVSGHGLIQERKIGINPETGNEYEIHEFEVFGKEMKAVIMLPGYTHSITNLDQNRDLVTVMWANEAFNPAKPDTFMEEVVKYAD